MTTNIGKTFHSEKFGEVVAIKEYHGCSGCVMYINEVCERDIEGFRCVTGVMASTIFIKPTEKKPKSYTATQILQYITLWHGNEHNLTLEDIERRLDSAKERTERIQKIEAEIEKLQQEISLIKSEI